MSPRVQVVAGRYLVRADTHGRLGRQRGGKVMACEQIAGPATAGLVTAGSRHSPQVAIVAAVAASRGLACRVHVPEGEPTDSIREAQGLGAEVLRHKPGHNSVIRHRAAHDPILDEPGWVHVPFGMEHPAGVMATRRTCAAYLSTMPHLRGLVVPVGSGMSLAGILWALEDWGRVVPVVGVVVGADPTKRLDRWAPPLWRGWVALEPAGVPYHQEVEVLLPGVGALHPVYEAKAWARCHEGWALWMVGSTLPARLRPPEGPVLR